MLPITAADTSKSIAAADLETDSTNTATARQYCCFTVRTRKDGVFELANDNADAGGTLSRPGGYTALPGSANYCRTLWVKPVLDFLDAVAE